MSSYIFLPHVDDAISGGLGARVAQACIVELETL